MSIMNCGYCCRTLDTDYEMTWVMTSPEGQKPSQELNTCEDCSLDLEENWKWELKE